VSALDGLPSSQPVSISGDVLPQYPSSGGADLAIGRLAPSLDGLDFNSQPISITPGTDAYMLVFVAHWCPHCNSELGRLLDWKQSGGVPAGLRVVAVSTAVSTTGAHFPPAVWLSGKGWTWPVLVDQSQGDGLPGVAAEAYGAPGWPYFVIVGADGTVKARGSGEVDSTELQRIVAAALAS
jgi:thiol-disulfide isomerase/thioredoxin